MQISRRDFIKTAGTASALLAADGFWVAGCTRQSSNNIRMKELFLLNEDWMHYLFTRTEEELDVENLEAFIDQYAGGKVTHLFLNPNGQRASFRSKSREALWDPVPGLTEEELQNDPNQQVSAHHSLDYIQARKNAKILHDKGIDPYEVWIRRCREKEISPWLSMRMNDVHRADVKTHYFHSEFWRSNPQYWRVPNYTGNYWFNCALDYAHQAVREHQFTFLEELLERYDPDGIELDWQRGPYNLRSGRFKEDTHFLDGFVRDTRNLTKKWAARRGHDIGLAVRVPSHPDAAEGFGLNAARWAREGWCDMIIAAPYFATSDYDARIDLWRERIGYATEDVRLLACADVGTQAFPGAKFAYHADNVLWTYYDLPFLYGFIDNARFRGADGIYLFNWYDNGSKTPPDGDYRKLLAKGIEAEIIRSEERRYPVTYRDIDPGSETKRDVVVDNIQLPKETDVAQTIRIPMGSIPKNGSVFLILGFEKRDGLETATFTASLNGKDLGQHDDEYELQRMAAPQRAVKFRVPLASLQAGENMMTLQPTAGTVQRLVWVELRVPGFIR